MVQLNDHLMEMAEEKRDSDAKRPTPVRATTTTVGWLGSSFAEMTTASPPLLPFFSYLHPEFGRLVIADDSGRVPVPVPMSQCTHLSRSSSSRHTSTSFPFWPRLKSNAARCEPYSRVNHILSIKNYAIVSSRTMLSLPNLDASPGFFTPVSQCSSLFSTALLPS
jgi:hypothetical protein